MKKNTKKLLQVGIDDETLVMLKIIAKEEERNSSSMVRALIRTRYRDYVSKLMQKPVELPNT